MKYCALIPAAGYGVRMQSARPKQYLLLNGRPLLWHTIAALICHPLIEKVALLLSPNDTHFVLTTYQEIPHIEKLAVYYCGGQTRAETVYQGLEVLQPFVNAATWILVHDAARPCLSFMLLDQLICTVTDDPVGGILALPIADTVKIVNMQHTIEYTIPRERLWLAQTPQMFRYQLLCHALKNTSQVTDESSAIEAQGYTPCVVPSSTHNIKVTYPDDIQLAEAILRVKG